MPRLMDPLLRYYFRYRQRVMDRMVADPGFFQQRILQALLKRQQYSQYGQQYNFANIKSYKEFQAAVPIVKYEDLADDILLMMDGKESVLVTDKVKWFARSSGTTKGRSKFIPVTQNYLVNGHLKCTWNTASVIYNEDQQASLFADKSLIMGGSLEELGGGRFVGDISAIMLKNFPKIGRRFSTPDFEVALDANWDRKIKYIAQHCTQERVTLLGGVPTWTLVLFKEILKRTGNNNICEVWPELRSYLHGGIGFEPYRKIFREFLPLEQVVFREIYNASEGYFAIQNHKDEDGMVLLCDHQIFYEFIPLSELDKAHPQAYPLTEVVTGLHYAMVITNPSGLYRYLLGDVVEFVSVQPYKLKVRGRTEQFINVFGEELMIANADQAISEVCSLHEAVIKDYTVAPIFMEQHAKGGHEWFIEFAKAPDSLEYFAEDLDNKLREINSDYDAKRYKDLAMQRLQLTVLPKDSLEKWQRQHDRFGGQNKMPRLANDRGIVDSFYS